MSMESETGFATVTAKGQIVIPKGIRKRAGINEKDRLACFNAGEFVVLRKVEIPDLQAEFRRISEKFSKFAAEKGIRERDVINAVRKERAESRSRH